jgi:hypothetical protein
MSKKYFAVTCLSILLFSCTPKKAVNYFPVPDSGISKDETTVFINIGNVIETKNGAGNQIPAWLRSYLGSGIGAVEKLGAYNNKYVFIIMNEGENIAALTKWAEYYTIEHDFPTLAAVRIGERMYLTANMYPDDEYGAFYEAMIHNAYNAEYSEAVKEDNYWIKTKSENAEELSENFIFFILITIEKSLMQTIINNMIDKTSAAVKITSGQGNSVKRLRNTFFEWF